MTAFYRRRLNHFRQNLPLSIVIRVQIAVEGRRIGTGKMCDLSLGGMGVLLDRWTSACCSKCTVRFSLPREKRSIELPCKIVHCQPQTNGLLWGIVFSDINEPFRDGERLALWDFLSEQHLKRHPYSTVAGGSAER